MEADAVQQAGMALGVVYDDVMPGGKCVDGGDDTLIAEIVKERVLLLLELRELTLESLVVTGMAGHHARTHRVSETPLRGGFRVSLAHLGMVGQSEIVVEAPVEHRHAVENHMGAEFALETGIHVIAEALLKVLSDRTARVPFDSVKNV